jgi:hypothetical protein
MRWQKEYAMLVERKKMSKAVKFVKRDILYVKNVFGQHPVFWVQTKGKHAQYVRNHYDNIKL